MNIQLLASSAAVEEARSLVVRSDRATLEEQARIAAIPAPSGNEGARAVYVRDRFAALGLEVATDEVGNVVALRRGESREGGSYGAPVLVIAHLDTIFPAGTDVKVRFEGSRLVAPGITDNARGLAAVLAVAGAIREAATAPSRPVIFVASVGEEGLGDLRGMKHLFRPGSNFRKAAAVLVVDGAGETRIVNQAVGATRIRATITGPGGHSWGDRGRPNAVHAASRAIAEISRLEPAGDGVASSVTVGRIGGGTSINAIPAECWFELDLRADEAATLQWLEQRAVKIVESATAAESGLANRGRPLSCGIEWIGSRPSGAVPRDAPIVRTATAVTTFLGLTPEYVASSTDANVPIALGVPAVAIGAGGRAGGVHTFNEWFENQDGSRGIERVLLTVLALAGVQGFDPLV